MNPPVFHVRPSSSEPCISRRFRTRLLAAHFIAAAFAAALGAPAATAAPSAGDTYVYRVSNGYNSEVVGQVRYRVDSLDGDRVTMSVTPEVPSLGTPRTEVYTADGNWLRHPLTNHDQPVEYEFSQAFPAYQFPLAPGKSWSVRVGATNPATGRRNSVRIDGEVLGTERILVPAGEFDTIKVRRRVYAGDWDFFLRETSILETDWYAPALGRAVRSESKSEWQDMSRCGRGGPPCLFRGDWNVLELAEASAAKS
jgi:hypothetical protein